MLKKIFKILPFLVVFMAQTPYNEIFSNISTYIPSYILEKLPVFIQDKSFDLYATIGATLLIVISFIPFKRYNQKIQFLYKNLKKYCTQKKYNRFISFHDAIAKIIEQLDVKQLCKYYKLNEHTIYLYLTYERFNSFELFVILTLIREDKLTIYAHKVIGIGDNTINTTYLSLQKIPKSLFLTCDIYSAKSWSDNYNTIYNSIHGTYKYTNVSMKLEELDDFIKKHKSI